MHFTMADFTTNQWAILALIFVAGLLLGMMARSGSGRWRREAAAERTARIEAERTYEARIKAANARIAELEASAPAVGIGTAGAIGAAARGARDDLALIRGIGRGGETRLNEAGYHSYRDVESMSASDEAALEGRLGLDPGTIGREGWREQAAMLRQGKAERHREMYGAV
jgi:predicted flap endonuclease-1-like 5' DNA nuclease